jgi:predicted DNA-binding protein (MmcQ/YjbR family)
MPKDINAAVREVLLSFPEAEEYLSHGSPNFRVRGKTFAAYLVNHHGDGRIALWLNAPDGAQHARVSMQPKFFFVPPYVGPKGWLGVHLDQGLSWDEIAELAREAYEKVAPPALSIEIGDTISIEPPTITLDPAELDPLSTTAAQAIYQPLRELCLALPEVIEDRSFGSPVWRAGKKTFVSIWGRDARIKLAFWVGLDLQPVLTADQRFEIPMYMGHNGWISLDVTEGADWDEIRALALQSYRHFAGKRMLAKLDAA